MGFLSHVARLCGSHDSNNFLIRFRLFVQKRKKNKQIYYFTETPPELYSIQHTALVTLCAVVELVVGEPHPGIVEAELFH